MTRVLSGVLHSGLTLLALMAFLPYATAETVRGDWVLGHNRDHQEEFGLREAPRSAYTNEVRKKGAHLALNRCTLGEISFSFISDTMDYKPATRVGNGHLILWSNVKRNGKFAIADTPILVDRGYEDTFALTGLDEIRKGSHLRICAKEGAPATACHVFSLDGFSKGLEYVCGAAGSRVSSR